MQRRKTFGGGVSPRGTLLRGQGIIEYVLIIAIIGLVIVFAGPGGAGTPSATTDKVFLLSTTEVYGDLQSDGTQYEYYKSKGVSTPNYYRASWDYQH